MSEATIASLEEQLLRVEADIKQLRKQVIDASEDSDKDFFRGELNDAKAERNRINAELSQARSRRDGAMVQEAVDKAVESVKIQADKEKEKAVEEAKRGPSLLGGFPGRLNVDESTSANAAKSMGTKTRLQNVNFHINLLSLFRPIFDLPKRKFAQGHAWHNYQTLAAKGFAKITTEAQIQELVRCVSLELCMMYQLDFDVKSGVGLSRGIPDVTLWRSIPFIVIEVKKFKGAFEHNAYQQVSKYLVCLRLDYGVPAPIAILTTYNGWQFCWHKYATPVAEATNIADVQRFRHELRDGDFDTLCVSPEYPCDSPFLRVLIVSLFYKMACLKHLTPVTKHCIWYSKARYQSKVADGLDPDKVDTSLEASREAKGLFFVKSLGGGAEGETYLMADKEGGCCAAKFYVLSGGKKADATPALPPAAAKKAAKEKCKKECDKWVGAYGPDCGVRVETLACSDVLLMPFFEPLSVDDWKDSGTMDIVMDHITELFDRRKVRHRDIEPRHVMWKNKIDQSVVLIDWGAATNVDANVNYASRKAYLAYAKKKLTEGIDALKKKAVADAEKQKADEAEKAEEAENTRNSLIAAMEAAKAAEAAKSEAVALASMPMRVTRSAAAAKAAKTPEALKAEEAEEAVKELDEAISNAKRASEMKEKAEQDAKAALKYARETAKAVQAATTEEKKSEAVAKAQNAAENEKAATQAAAKARRQAEAAGAALSSASWFMWKFDPVDDYEGDPRYPADDIAAMDKELQEDILKQRLEQEAKRKAR